MPWVRVKLTERGYYDPRTNRKLSSIEGMKNRPGVDPFESRGKEGYPVFDKTKILKWYEKEEDVLFKADITAEEAAKLGTVLTEEEAATVKLEIFHIVTEIEPESGTTK